ncbi:MAG: hypothetical protein KJ620_06770 [Candidatus Edwardsbacteria bacterium]|nr:hypothetical protein [Candidatus Edwardsbacteria bacterium]MBU1576289.1 hypothetical protein [Candidatus Edwardsbacteria bacterium]MBU2463488.1 hypothetical protein [Candidatus Edwardsbacteria bacterium]MBU2593902.1 hypothetical protein [Candidatus Edwardsbacteria bacterium]
MKKLIAIILIVETLYFVGSCGKSTPTSATDETATPTSALLPLTPGTWWKYEFPDTLNFGGTDSLLVTVSENIISGTDTTVNLSVSYTNADNPTSISIKKANLNFLAKYEQYNIDQYLYYLSTDQVRDLVVGKKWQINSDSVFSGHTFSYLIDTLTIVGIETIINATTTYNNCYKIEMKRYSKYLWTSLWGETKLFTGWVAPHIGIVKGTMVNFSDGKTMEIKLKSYLIK